MRKILTLAFLALAVFAMPVFAQTAQSASRQMSLVIVPFLSVTGVRDIDFGTHTRNQGPLFTDATNYAEWSVDTDPNNSINISFTLPSAMVNPQATGLSVPLSYGLTAGFIDQNASQFNPSTGLANDIVPTGHAVVRLGWPRMGGGDLNELVRADISNASTQGGGHYSAVVTLNVVINP
jgi:hypothetical protein